jgi:exodeoxyribonuclease VII small subunit
MPKDAKVESFEQLYARLEQSVAKLEEGGLPLDDAIALYEEGMTLAHRCQERLDEAEQKITKLKESYAPLPPRANGASPEPSPDEYEYVPDGDGVEQDEDPFA